MHTSALVAGFAPRRRTVASPTLVALPNPFESDPVDTAPFEDTTCFYFDAEPSESDAPPVAFEYEEGDSLEFAMPTPTAADDITPIRPRLLPWIALTASMMAGTMLVTTTVVVGAVALAF